MSVELEGLDFLFPVRVNYKVDGEPKQVFGYLDATGSSVWLPGCEELPEYPKLVALVADKYLAPADLPESDVDLSIFKQFEAVTPPTVEAHARDS